ncbi:MAG: hypothetical protein LBQ86_09340 [Holophagales bacterium]|jgi:BioD-like phosphotransacetylase family protein|nr:hypothetical protein [Holophagales bacterium]
MAQQNLTLVINVAAQECAKKVQEVAEALKQMGGNFDKVVINAREASEHFIEYQEVIQSHEAPTKAKKKKTDALKNFLQGGYF